MSVPDHFGLHTKTPSQKQIDTGADALRRVEQGGRLLRKWDDLPNATKEKWRAKAKTVPAAGLNA